MRTCSKGSVQAKPAGVAVGGNSSQAREGRKVLLLTGRMR